MNSNAKPTKALTLRLNDFELNLLRNIAKKEKRSLQNAIKNILITEAMKKTDIREKWDGMNVKAKWKEFLDFVISKNHTIGELLEKTTLCEMMPTRLIVACRLESLTSEMIQHHSDSTKSPVHFESRLIEMWKKFFGEDLTITIYHLPTPVWDMLDHSKKF